MHLQDVFALPQAWIIQINYNFHTYRDNPDGKNNMINHEAVINKLFNE